MFAERATAHTTPRFIPLPLKVSQTLLALRQRGEDLDSGEDTAATSHAFLPISPFLVVMVKPTLPNVKLSKTE